MKQVNQLSSDQPIAGLPLEAVRCCTSKRWQTDDVIGPQICQSLHVVNQSGSLTKLIKITTHLKILESETEKHQYGVADVIQAACRARLALEMCALHSVLFFNHQNS